MQGDGLNAQKVKRLHKRGATTGALPIRALGNAVAGGGASGSSDGVDGSEDGASAQHRGQHRRQRGTSSVETPISVATLTTLGQPAPLKATRVGQLPESQATGLGQAHTIPRSDT